MRSWNTWSRGKFLLYYVFLLFFNHVHKCPCVGQVQVPTESREGGGFPKAEVTVSYLVLAWKPNSGLARTVRALN